MSLLCNIDGAQREIIQVAFEEFAEYIACVGHTVIVGLVVPNEKMDGLYLVSSCVQSVNDKSTQRRLDHVRIGLRVGGRRWDRWLIVKGLIEKCTWEHRVSCLATNERVELKASTPTIAQSAMSG